MTRLSVTIPDDLERFVEAEASAHGYETAGEFVVALIGALHQRRELESLEQTLLRRIDGPSAIELTKEVWGDLEARVRRRVGSRA